MKKSIVIFTTALLLMPIFIGCENADEGKPPELPPYESMFIDFSSFKVQTNLPPSIPKTELQTKLNFQFSAIQVGVWSTILTLTLAVPVASFYTAFSKTPKYLGNAKWEWSYDGTGLAATYTARLTGEITSTNIKWEMYIAKTGVNSFSEFKWFEGTSNLDGESGQWLLYYSNVYPEKLLQIDWEKSGDQIGSIKYTYVRELNNQRTTDTFNGSYILHGLKEGSYNAFYTIHFFYDQLQQFVDVNIEWNTTTYNGHVKAPYWFHDEVWHCWNGVGDDIVCP